jgi:hypothetical protein
MMAQQPDEAPQAATRLLAQVAGVTSKDATATGTCCFCGVNGDGVHVNEATSEKYFSDDPLLAVPSSDHVCAACAWAMDQRRFKQGHWIVHSRGVETPSTGGLLGHFRQLRAGEHEPPLSVHVTSSPIRSSHSYLWTPVNATTRPLTVAYDRERVRIETWADLAALVAAVEDLRLHGFTFDELRSGEPRTGNVASIGIRRYRERDRIIAPHRRTARLELALTLSRSADDQPRTNLTDAYDPFGYEPD